MTAFVEIALTALVPSITKLLVNAYLGAGAAEVAGSLTASASGPFGETLKRRQLTRRIEWLADQVAVELTAALESDGVRPEAFGSIVKEIEIALSGCVQANWLGRQSLNAEKIKRTLESENSISQSHYSDDERHAYSLSLDYLSGISVDWQFHCRNTTTNATRRY